MSFFPQQLRKEAQDNGLVQDIKDTSEKLNQLLAKAKKRDISVWLEDSWTGRSIHGVVLKRAFRTNTEKLY